MRVYNITYFEKGVHFPHVDVQVSCDCCTFGEVKGVNFLSALFL